MRYLQLREAATSEDAMSSLAQGDWPRLTLINLAGHKLYSPALHALTKGKWPLLASLSLSVNLQAVGVMQTLGCSTALHTLACQDLANLHFDASSPHGPPPQLFQTYWPGIEHVILEHRGKEPDLPCSPSSNTTDCVMQ